MVNVSSGLGDLSCVSPALQKQFSSPKLTFTEITSLMEKYIRYKVTQDKLSILAEPVNYMIILTIHII